MKVFCFLFWALPDLDFKRQNLLKQKSCKIWTSELKRLNSLRREDFFLRQKYS